MAVQDALITSEEVPNTAILSMKGIGAAVAGVTEGAAVATDGRAALALADGRKAVGVAIVVAGARAAAAVTEAAKRLLASDNNYNSRKQG